MAGPYVRMVEHNDGSRSVTARDDTTKELVISTYGPPPEGDLKLQRKYQLDRYGKPTAFFIYDGTGRPLVRGEFTYDAQDRVIEEKWFELPSERPIRTLAQNFDAKGGRLPPQYMHQASLPPEVVRWLDPDAAARAEESAKKGQKNPRFSLKRKDKEKVPPPTDGGGSAGAPGSKPGGLQGIFQKLKK